VPKGKIRFRGVSDGLKNSAGRLDKGWKHPGGARCANNKGGVKEIRGGVWKGHPSPALKKIAKRVFIKRGGTSRFSDLTRFMAKKRGRSDCSY